MNYYINKILQEKTITSYLEEKGIYPQKKTGDKSVYLCPVHQGDTSPSFIVYPVGTKGRDYQTYHCFGCHSGITLINLKSALEKIPTREVIKSFLKNIDINYEDARESIIKDYRKGELGIEYSKDIENTILLINSTSRNHLANDCKLDEEEIDFFENFFKKVDSIARSKDLKTLESVYEILIEGNIKRMEKYKQRQEDKEISSAVWKM